MTRLSPSLKERHRGMRCVSLSLSSLKNNVRTRTRETRFNLLDPSLNWNAPQWRDLVFFISCILFIGIILRIESEAVTFCPPSYSSLCYFFFLLLFLLLPQSDVQGTQYCALYYTLVMFLSLPPSFSTHISLHSLFFPSENPLSKLILESSHPSFITCLPWRQLYPLIQRNREREVFAIQWIFLLLHRHRLSRHLIMRAEQKKQNKKSRTHSRIEFGSSWQSCHLQNWMESLVSRFVSLLFR